MPEIATDGMLVAGDAAALCLAAGIWLEGVNFAIGSGMAAGEVAHDALGRRRRQRDRAWPRTGASSKRSFVLADHQKLRRVPELLMSQRMQHLYPKLACDARRAAVHGREPEAQARRDTPRPRGHQTFRRCACATSPTTPT